MSDNKTTVDQSCGEPKYRVPIRERFRVAYQNCKVRKVGKAWRTIEKAIRDDPGYRITIHANIAMPIYDATRPWCSCGIHSSPMPEHGGHRDSCAKKLTESFTCHEMGIEQANYISEIIIRHLF